MEVNRPRTGSEGMVGQDKKSDGETMYMWEEVKKHTSHDDLWFVIDN